MTEEIVDGVKIITYDNGDLKFIPVDNNTKSKSDSRSWFGKLIDWFMTGKVTPYVKVKDISDPTNKFKDSLNSESDYIGPSGAEIGIKIRF